MRRHQGFAWLALPLLLAACSETVDARRFDRDRDGIFDIEAPGSGGFIPAAQQDPRLVEVMADDVNLNPTELVAEPGERLIVVLRNQSSHARVLEFELEGDLFAHDRAAAPGENAALNLIAPVQPDAYPFRALSRDGDGPVLPGMLRVQAVTSVRLDPIADGLTMPIALVVPPGNRDGRRFVVDQVGLVRMLTADDRLLDAPFADLRSRLVELDPEGDQRGLLGLAFHPAFADNGRVFVSYSGPLRAEAPRGWDHTSYVTELRVSSAHANTTDPAYEQVVLAIDRPHADHPGGTIAFGPHDRMLYVAVGDGRLPLIAPPSDEPSQTASQERESWAGTILRIDVDAVDSDRAYVIPADNPFVGTDAQQEVFASGFHDPRGFAFDSAAAHALMVPDTGSALWEEVNRVQIGGDYGWHVQEGTHCIAVDDATRSERDCALRDQQGTPLLWPVIEFPNGNQEGGVGHTVIGGGVYRGSILPALAGSYVFGTLVTGGDGPRSLVMAAREIDSTGQDLWPIERVAFAGDGQYYLGHILHGIGTDQYGELYLLASDQPGPTGQTGRVLQLEAPGR